MQQNSFDLHCHTSSSDGTLSPSDLVKKAYQSGIHTLAITDHDTISGIPQALQAAANYSDVTIIPGVEISVDYKPGTMHMCGYFIDTHNQQFLENLDFFQASRTNRNPKIIQKLQDTGFEITLNEVKNAAGNDQIGRPHFAQVLVDKGYVSSIQEAFDKYLKNGAPCYVNRPRISIEKALNMIKNAGGISVVAHPSLLDLGNKEHYQSYLQQLKSLGLDGLEVFSSHHTKEEDHMFYEIGKNLNMLITGGSDFHGDNHPDVKLGAFGNELLLQENIIEDLYSFHEHINKIV